MKTNPELDKFAAEKCGIKLHRNLFPKTSPVVEAFLDDCKWHQFKWTLSDARCREIVREYFKIITNVSYAVDSNWMSHQHFHTDWCHGDTIEAAEIAVIQAIKDAEGE